MYRSFVFLEVRVLIPSFKKAFCTCEAGKGGAKCSICMRMPDTAPILEENIAYNAYRLAHNLGCTLIPEALYDYPSRSPSTPPEYPLCGSSVKIAEHGMVTINFHQHRKQIDIVELRIEEDAGRLVHVDQKTYMDYTSAGMPSIRIRTGNTIELGEEAELFLVELKNRMNYLGILGDRQHNHSIRCNAYVASTRYPLQPAHYVKLRNLNSFNFVRNAVNVDLRRQEELLRQGKIVQSESRLWNARSGCTDSYQGRDFIDTIQTKIAVKPHYFTLSDAGMTEILRTAPEEQQSRKAKYIKNFGLSAQIVQVLCEEARFADFFDAVVQCGGHPKSVADRLVSDIVGLLKRVNKTVHETHLTPEYFARILSSADDGVINNAIVRTILYEIIVDDVNPQTVLATHKWSKISDKTALKQMIHTILENHPNETVSLKAGMMKYLDILTGLVMKKSRGYADPLLIKQLIKEELDITVVYVLAMGGAISGHITDGRIVSGSAGVLSELLGSSSNDYSVQFENITPKGLLSEELEPADWACLISAVCSKLASGTANGIVLTHGTHTLMYTAPLIYWLFAHTATPIVLTASSTTPDQSAEAKDNLCDAIRLAREKQGGVYVSFNKRVLSPLNLKFIDSSQAGFVNWNMQKPIFDGEGLITNYNENDMLIFEGLLTEASHRMFLIKTYPGIRTEFLIAFLQKNIRIFFLELYERGTANMKESPYSLEEFLNRGKKYDCRFYCTSQQESSVDFCGEESSRRVWKAGAVPMGTLTTETAIALYYAASLVCDTAEELNTILETAAQESGKR